MPNSITDLPDIGKLDENKPYLIDGKGIRAIVQSINDLWAGRNIGKGPNILIRQTGTGGYTLSASGGDTYNITPVAPFPFQIYVVAHTDDDGDPDGTYDVTLYPGTINQFMPSNMFDVVNISADDDQYITLDCESDGYGITSCTWNADSDAPDPAEATSDTPPSSFSVLLGVVHFDDDDNMTIGQTVNTSLSATPIEWLRTDNPDADPFGLPYTSFYAWKITGA